MRIPEMINIISTLDETNAHISLVLIKIAGQRFLRVHLPSVTNAPVNAELVDFAALSPHMPSSIPNSLSLWNSSLCHCLPENVLLSAP